MTKTTRIERDRTPMPEDLRLAGVDVERIVAAAVAKDDKRRAGGMKDVEVRY